MAVELKFSKSEDGTWGFRLAGGVDFDEPLVVVKVIEHSIAEAGGLKEGDVLVRINDTPAAGLTHLEAHDLLLTCTTELQLAVRRDLPIASQEKENHDNDEEVSNILKNTEQTSENNIDQTQETENLPSQKLLNEPVCQKQKKWSTFLQKPANPPPSSKPAEQRKIEGEPYKVVIKKQQRKKDPRIVYTEIETTVTDEIQVEVTETEEPKTEGEDVLQIEVEETVDITKHVQVEEETVIEIEKGEEDNSKPEEKDPEQDDFKKRIEEFMKDNPLKRKKSSLISIPDLSVLFNENSAPLEEQLVQVQQQLMALAQLPAVIQTTLEAVNQQLATLASRKNSILEVPEDEERSSTEPITTEDHGSASEEAERDVTEDQERDDVTETDEVLEEQEECNGIGGEEIEAEPQESQEEALSVKEEEKEEKEIEDPKLAKQQKKMNARELKPIDRPIILPGGRRWSQPDDACPSVRHPKMSDEKIANTIETYSEVLVGRTKGWTTGTGSGLGATNPNRSTGKEIFRESNCYMVPSKAIATKRINFLKYQPPPKNMDFLQKSEVYRLVHEMEPPVKGISSRVEKLLSEQDYYEAKSGP